MESNNITPTENDGRRETWFRLLFVILFAFIYTVAEIVLVAVVVLQFGFKLITGACNDALLQFSSSLNQFVFQILQFATFRSDEKPFPFSGWPAPAAPEDKGSVDSASD